MIFYRFKLYYTMNKQKENAKVIEDLIIGNLNAIYGTCEKSAKAFQRDDVSLVFLKLVIEKAKPKLTGDKGVDALVTAYWRTLDVLYQICSSRSKMVYKNNDSITLRSLSFFIETVKTEYKSALKDV